MVAVWLNSGALHALSHDYKDVYHAIKNIQDFSIDETPNFPQIVVVGDQSSGKSSVLEAISGIEFPGGRCTQFATEFIIRRKHAPKIVATIRAGDDGRVRHVFEEDMLYSSLPILVQKARTAMGQYGESTSISDEVFCVEVGATDVEPMTFVDLPGFNSTEITENYLKDNKIAVKLAEKYMKQKNSIILAVVSASVDISQQRVLDVVRMHDPTGERTIGIITMLDTLEADSAEEKKYLRLVSNEEADYKLRHGWHVLCNISSEEYDETSPKWVTGTHILRDLRETEFFDSGAWASYSINNKGIVPLRIKLSTIISTQLYNNLPSIIQKTEIALGAYRNSFKVLGKFTSKLTERQEYLYDIFCQFRDIAVAAVKGSYGGEFFTEKCLNLVTCDVIASDPKRLRAVIRNLNRAFVAVMSARGSKFHITGYGKAKYGPEEFEIPQYLSKWVAQFATSQPIPVPWILMKPQIQAMVSNNQGTRFSKPPIDELGLKLFREQSERWKSITLKYLDLVTDAVKEFVDLALSSVVPAGRNTREKIIEAYTEPFFAQRSVEMKEKLDELLQNYQEGDIICLEDSFLAEFNRREQPRMTDETPKATTTGFTFGNPPKSNVHTQQNGSQLNDFDPGIIIDVMNAYYSVCLPIFMDNVVILIVENCLISKLSTILDPKTIYSMGQTRVRKLTGNTTDDFMERFDTLQDIDTLAKALETCKNYLAVKSLVPTSAESQTSQQLPERPSGEEDHRRSRSEEGRDPSQPAMDVPARQANTPDTRTNPPSPKNKEDSTHIETSQEKDATKSPQTAPAVAAEGYYQPDGSLSTITPEELVAECVTPDTPILDKISLISQDKDSKPSGSTFVVPPITHEVKSAPSTKPAPDVSSDILGDEESGNKTLPHTYVDKDSKPTNEVFTKVPETSGDKSTISPKATIVEATDGKDKTSTVSESQISTATTKTVEVEQTVSTTETPSTTLTANKTVENADSKSSQPSKFAPGSYQEPKSTTTDSTSNLPGAETKSGRSGLFGTVSPMTLDDPGASRASSSTSPTRVPVKPSQTGLFGSSATTASIGSAFGDYHSRKKLEATNSSTGFDLFNNLQSNVSSSPRSPSLFGAKPLDHPTSSGSSSIFNSSSSNTKAGSAGSQNLFSTSSSYGKSKFEFGQNITTPSNTSSTGTLFSSSNKATGPFTSPPTQPQAKQHKSS